MRIEYIISKSRQILDSESIAEVPTATTADVKQPDDIIVGPCAGAQSMI